MSLVFDMPFAIPKNGLDPQRFTEAMACMPSPIAVISTIAADGRPVGATLSAVSSLSLDPPLFLACFDHRSDTLRAVRNRRRYLVHILSHEQTDVAKTFASKATNKFQSVRWHATATGLPELEDCRVILGCRLFSVLPGGDHVVVVGEVESATVDPARSPMIYADRRMTSLATGDPAT